MVDNVSISEGDGDKTIATDDVGGVQYQRIKISWGGDGSATEVDAASGKPFPIQLRGSAGGDVVKLEDDASANADPGVPMLAVRKAAPANTSGTDGDYEFLQMSSGRLWVDASGVTQNVIAGQTGVAGGSGAVSAATQRVTIASDDPLSAAIKAEDDASANADKGMVIFAKRKDPTPATSTGADGDYEPLQLNNGRLWCSAQVEVIGPGENHVGEVGGKTTVFDLTLSLDTAARACG